MNLEFIPRIGEGAGFHEGMTPMVQLFRALRTSRRCGRLSLSLGAKIHQSRGKKLDLLTVRLSDRDRFSCVIFRHGPLDVIE